MKYTNNDGKGRDTASDKGRDFSPRGAAAVFSAKPDDVVFINIEGVPELASTNDLSDTMRQLWESLPHPAALSTDEAYRAMGLCAEFGKVACMTAGVIRSRAGETEPYFITSTYAADDERQVLCDFSEMIGNFFSTSPRSRFVCGHGIHASDVPFFAKRLIVNRLPLPALFDKHGRRWLDENVIDTADFWAMGNADAPATSAPLLASVLGIDVDPTDYDAIEAATLYHDDHDLRSLAQRSERKVLVAARIFRAMRGESPISGDHVIRKE